MKFKKLLIVLTSAMLVASLCACGRNAVAKDIDGNDNRMVIVYSDGFCIIYADTETGCQYLSRNNCGTCLMVDADGQPLLYDVED
jgi:hypothetical protein